jgi:hypothetical protein
MQPAQEPSVTDGRCWPTAVVCGPDSRHRDRRIDDAHRISLTVDHSAQGSGRGPHGLDPGPCTHALGVPVVAYCAVHPPSIGIAAPVRL